MSAIGWDGSRHLAPISFGSMISRTPFLELSLYFLLRYTVYECSCCLAIFESCEHLNGVGPKGPKVLIVVVDAVDRGLEGGSPFFCSTSMPRATSLWSVHAHKNAALYTNDQD